MNKWAPAVAVFAIVTLALLALYRLLLLQYDSGDAYPVYSSYRADPLGVLIFHDAAASATGVAPQRNLAPLDHASFAPDSTLLLAGAGVSKDEVSTIERLEAYIEAGGRMVVLFRPGEGRRAQGLNDGKKKKDPGTDDKAEAKDRKKRKETAKERRDREQEMMDTLVPRADISERWGFGYDSRDLPLDAKSKHVVEVHRTESAPAMLPEQLMWHSELVLADVAPEWTTIYERGQLPVVIERPWGKGSIVVATDNYLISNEAMLSDRAPGYLAWIAGSGRTLIFEETRLGVQKSTGVMTLVKRYGLIPVLCIGVLLALLFIWRNAVPLVPRRVTARSEDTVVASHSTVAGIASLVRRAIGRPEILETSWRLYQAPAMRRVPVDATRRAAVERALAEYRETPARRRNPVVTFNQISAIINERKANS